MPNEIQTVSVQMPERKRNKSLKGSLLLSESLTLEKNYCQRNSIG